LKKFAILGLAIVAMLSMTAVAVAQYALPSIQVTGTVSPSKGGTKKKPKNAKLNVAFTVNKESRKTVERITYYVPANVRLSGSGFRFCPASQINQQGEGKCPKGSKVGTGTATAVLGPNFAPLGFTVNVYAGSKNELALALAQTGGGSVRTAFRGLITSAGTPFGQKITVDVPKSVQSPATGLYSYITGVKTSIGGKFTSTKKVTKKVKGKKKKVTVKTTHYFASLTGCPKDKTHDFGVQLGYSANDTGPSGTSDQVRDTAACKS